MNNTTFLLNDYTLNKMSLDFLPKELEHIITDYIVSIKFNNCMDELLKVSAERSRNVEYTYGLNHTHWELWCFHNYGSVEIVLLTEEIINKENNYDRMYTYQIVDNIYANDEDL